VPLSLPFFWILSYVISDDEYNDDDDNNNNNNNVCVQ
jgi:hypothetical protein